MHLRNEYIAFFFNGLRVKSVFNIRGTAVLELNDSPETNNLKLILNK